MLGRGLCGLLAVTVVLALAAARDERALDALAARSQPVLTWRQAEILVVRGRVHSCQRELGRPLSPVAERVIAGGTAYRTWVLRLWRKRDRFYCGAARELQSRFPYGVWDRLASCESGGRWDYNGSSGFDGGLQFHPGTWSAYRPSEYPWFAYQASREQQIVVAGRVLASQGWGAWPACSAKLGLR